MLKKTIRRLGALAMVLEMAVSVFAVSASAAEATVVKEKKVTITKNIDAKEKVLVPGATYEFTIAPGNADTAKNIYAGEMTPISKSAKNNYTYEIAFTQGDTVKSKTCDFMITAESFTKPGIYAYTVTESAVTVDGMTTAPAKTMLVYVEQVDGKNSIAAVIVDNRTTGTNKSDLDFTNIYATNNVTVKKVITGNQADLSAKWEFKITVTGQPGETFATSTDEVLQSGVEATIYLGDKDTITIYGLSESDTYTVKEEKHNTDGYVTTIDGNKTNDGTTSGDAKAGDVSIEYVNHKQITTPGGVIMTIAPYALMLVVAGAFAVVFLSRRNRAE